MNLFEKILAVLLCSLITLAGCSKAAAKGENTWETPAESNEKSSLTESFPSNSELCKMAEVLISAGFGREWSGFEDAAELSSDELLNIFIFASVNKNPENFNFYADYCKITDPASEKSGYLVDISEIQTVLDKYLFGASFCPSEVSKNGWTIDGGYFFTENYEQLLPSFGLIRKCRINSVRPEGGAVAVSGGFCFPNSDIPDGSSFDALLCRTENGFVFRSFSFKESEKYLCGERASEIKSSVSALFLKEKALLSEYCRDYTDYEKTAIFTETDGDGVNWYYQNIFCAKSFSEICEELSEIYSESGCENMKARFGGFLRNIGGKLCFRAVTVPLVITDYREESFSAVSVTESRAEFYLTTDFPRYETKKYSVSKNLSGSWVLDEGFAGTKNPDGD